MVSRRKFLSTLAAGTCGAAVHQMSFGGTSMMAWANPPIASALGASPVFVLINMSGGASYNWAPIYHGSYLDKNPNVSYTPEQSLPVAGDQGFHPSLTTYKQVFDQGNLALFNMAGIDNQSRSHDEATNQWFSASSRSMISQGGWAARLTSQVASFFAGVSLGGTNLLISGGANPPRSLGDLQNFGEDRFKWDDQRTEWLRMTRDNLMAASTTAATDSLNFVKGSMNNVEFSSRLIQEQTSQALPTITNPFPNTGFARACRDAARLILAPALGVRFIFLQMGSFDTHSEERPRMTELLNELNGGLRSLVQTLQVAGRWNDTIIANMSEFCRTMENGSAGTDHGAGGPMVVLGGQIAGRVVNPAPDAGRIANAGSFLEGYDVDFRQVYAEIVGAMGYNPDVVFPQRRAGSYGIFRA